MFKNIEVYENARFRESKHGALFLRPLYNILIMFSNWDSRSTEVHWVLRVTSHLDLTRSGCQYCLIGRVK